MLLRFSVSNFGSIRDRQELSMIAAKAIKDDDAGLIEASALRGEKVLPAAVIYGANASGKSTVIKALQHMQGLVQTSHTYGAPSGGVQLTPFLLDPAYHEHPTEYALDFVLGEERYSYSFAATPREFVSESLYIWQNGSRKRLFERRNGEFKFGSALKGTKRTIEKLTRKNSLFISTAAQNNHEQLAAISTYINSFFVDIRVLNDEQKINTAFLTENSNTFDLFNDQLIKLLSNIDTGIESIRITDTRVDSHNSSHKSAIDAFFSNLPDYGGLEVLKKLTYPREKKIEFGHTSGNHDKIFLDVSNESTGTVEIFALSTFIFSALLRGTPLVIDEFGSRVHTRASELIIQLFQNKETNPKGAQLIVTTHDTNLLNIPGLRRDQVWFTEKDGTGATNLYPLTDIETRKGDNLEKGYLQGRYGAIPFPNSLSDFKKTQ